MIHPTAMTDDLDSLILDLLEWLGSSPRPYAEVLDAWRTSCPRLPVWEDANDRGFVECHHEPGRGRCVSVSIAGAEYLRNNRVDTNNALTRRSTVGGIGLEPPTSSV
jgi:hypothetical protein